jgi:hypothetical protein
MIVASHSLVNTVMTEHPEQLLHMDTVGPSQVRSMGGKWNVLMNVIGNKWVFKSKQGSEVGGGLLQDLIPVYS